MAVHDRKQLESFMRAEGRLVYARYREEPERPAYFLVDGTASDPGIRELTKSLECLIPGCPNGRLKLVNRHAGKNQKRDGFSHFGGAGDHGPESVFHVNSKAMLEKWLRQRYPDVAVRSERS